MEKVVIADSWKAVFARNGIKTFSEFYYGIAKKRITRSRDKKRSVSMIELQTEKGPQKLFLKRFRHPHFKDILFTFLNTGRFQSQAGFEADNIDLLEKNGISVPKVAAFGEQVKLGLERRSFIILEEAKGQCMTDFIAQNWDEMPLAEKQKVISSLAKTIRKIHDANIGLTDLYLWHIFISENENHDYDFAFIDLNRMKRHVASRDEKIKNLGRLYFSMLDKYFNADMLKLLIHTYAGKTTEKDFEQLVAEVKKYSKKLSTVRRKKIY